MQKGEVDAGRRHSPSKTQLQVDRQATDSRETE